MSSTQESCSSTLSLTDTSIMETGFLLGSSNCSISPGNSCFLELSNISRPDIGDNASNLMMGNLLALKVTESSLNSLKGDLQASCDSAASICKNPSQTCAFDLSNGSCANSKADSSIDVICDTKSSTPCKEDKISKLENVLTSSEMNDPEVFKKPLPSPGWEISGIQDIQVNTHLSESSLEELGSLGSMKPDTQSL